MSMKALVIALALVMQATLSAGCGDQAAATSAADLPARLVGAYGQNEAHAKLATAGLELAGTTLKFGELTVTIKQGAATGADDYRVDAAEAVWAKDTKPPKACKGTISRQGNVLLVKLFKEGTDARCESVLDGEWRAWTLTDTLPEGLRGVYGGDARGEEADIGLRLAEKSIGFTDGGDAVAVQEVLTWVDKPTSALLRRSTFRDFGCVGSITRTDEELALSLTPVEGAPEGSVCPSGRGSRWSVDPKHLPPGTLDNGHVSLTAAGERLTLVDRQGLKCTQAILHTAARSVTGSAYDGIPVTGGAVLVLEHAVPEAGADTCLSRLRNVSTNLCAEYDLDRCAQAQAAVEQPVVCPRQIVIGDPTQGGFKAAMLPATITNLTCWDMTGIFAATK